MIKAHSKSSAVSKSAHDIAQTWFLWRIIILGSENLQGSSNYAWKVAVQIMNTTIHLFNSKLILSYLLLSRVIVLHHLVFLS